MKKETKRIVTKSNQVGTRVVLDMNKVEQRKTFNYLVTLFNQNNVTYIIEKQDNKRSLLFDTYRGNTTDNYAFIEIYLYSEQTLNISKLDAYIEKEIKLNLCIELDYVETIKIY